MTRDETEVCCHGMSSRNVCKLLKCQQHVQKSRSFNVRFWFCLAFSFLFTDIQKACIRLCKLERSVKIL